MDFSWHCASANCPDPCPATLPSDGSSCTKIAGTMCGYTKECDTDGVCTYREMATCMEDRTWSVETGRTYQTGTAEPTFAPTDSPTRSPTPAPVDVPDPTFQPTESPVEQPVSPSDPPTPTVAESSCDQVYGEWTVDRVVCPSNIKPKKDMSATLCPASVAMQEDFEISLANHLWKQCSSWCMYSFGNVQHAYQWKGVCWKHTTWARACINTKEHLHVQSMRASMCEL